jgi:CubicO group peptidase (beta-lactamase class C family)
MLERAQKSIDDWLRKRESIVVRPNGAPIIFSNAESSKLGWAHIPYPLPSRFCPLPLHVRRQVWLPTCLAGFVVRGSHPLDDCSAFLESFAPPVLADLSFLVALRENVEFYLTAKDAENWYPTTQADALDFEPGSQFAYSNPAFDGLALIVEQVSGMKWQSFVREGIFLPAGMTASTITDGPHPESGVARGYLKRGGEWVEADYGELPTFAAAGNGGVWSSVDELARFELALRNGVFLTPAVIADARTIKTFANWTSAKPPEPGYSWFIRQTPDHMRTVGHTGHQGGFTANYVTLPDKAIFFVTLSNSPRDIDAFAAEILEELKLASWLD